MSLLHGSARGPLGRFYISLPMVSAGDSQTVLLRSDGCAVAFGTNVEGQCNIPKLEQGVSYTQVSAGWSHHYSH